MLDSDDISSLVSTVVELRAEVDRLQGDVEWLSNELRKYTPAGEHTEPSMAAIKTVANCNFNGKRGRMVAAYLCCLLTDHSLPVVARHLGYGDHSSVVKARDLIASKRLDDPFLNQQLTKIETELCYKK